MENESVVYRVLAVDDGSSDRSAGVLADHQRKLPLDIVSHGQNRGLGMAIRSGILGALERSGPETIVVTMDADDTHNPDLIGRMLRQIDQGSDVVIASRFRPGAKTIGVPLYRRFTSVGASWLFRILFPTPGVRDFTCGYRAYRASLLLKARDQHGASLFEFEGFQSMVDLLLKLRAAGATFSEVPIILRYDQKEGASKMPVLRTTLRTLRLAVLRRLGL